VFLTASADERARRRVGDMQRMGLTVAGDEVKLGMERRDVHDSTRAASPLASAEDAVQLDTTGLTVDQVVDRIAELARAAR
jgi:cytidylate kinase